ncbi:MAG: AAA-like domain-containing protein [Prevotellaceae bacterium]|nr:AAA-like domain-containing protein [Prevotellaceae bacterium]
MKYFNIAGPCDRARHYMIEPSTRIKGVERLIDMEQYFVIHAARQSGKTTYLNDLTDRLNAAGQYYAIYCSLESLQGITDPREGIPEIVTKIKNTLKKLNFPYATEFAKNPDLDNFTDVLNMELTLFCKILDKPLVILFDEADCLSDDTLITFLRQLRDGYNSRSRIPFVHSIALVGMRNIRDYKAKIRPDSASLGSASPFNIVTKTYMLKNFTKDEIRSLYQQHTDDTGQQFDEAAIDTVYEQTQGQPWLVNAIACEVITEMLDYDYSKPVTKELVEEAIQTIILRRDTHIDSLLERLKEERVRKVIEPVIIGGIEQVSVLSDDYQYVIDLGLIRNEKHITIPANPIYAEVIARTLSADDQKYITTETPDFEIPRYLKNGRIDMDFLMLDFQQFWRNNSEIWEQRFDYLEAAPHLIMMAFLQRVVNGGGQIHRDMAAGTGRLDLCLVYENEKYPIELKIRYDTKTLEKGLVQTARYMGLYGCSKGWLAIFDRRKTVEWDSKLFLRNETFDGKEITVVGL